MKKLSLTLLFGLLCFNLFSQTENDSLLYSESTIKPFLFNGKKLSCEKTLILMESNYFAHQEMSIAKTYKDFSNLTFATGAVIVIWPFVEEIRNKNGKLKNVKLEILAFSVPFFVASTIFRSSYNNHSSNAIRIYNNRLIKSKTSNNVDFKVGFSGNKVGMQINF